LRRVESFARIIPSLPLIPDFLLLPDFLGEIPTLAKPSHPYRSGINVMRSAQQLIDFSSAEIAQKRLQPTATDVLATLVHAHDEEGAKLSEDELIEIG
jgi:cytochrome P450